MDAHRPVEHKGLTISERVRRNRGEVVCLRWALVVRPSRRSTWPARRQKSRPRQPRAGGDLYAAVHKRKNHPVAGAYVVLPLHVYIDVLRRLHPEELLSARVRSGGN
jgi:hypothetical protein